MRRVAIVLLAAWASVAGAAWFNPTGAVVYKDVCAIAGTPGCDWSGSNALFESWQYWETDHSIANQTQHVFRIHPQGQFFNGFYSTPQSAIVGAYARWEWDSTAWPSAGRYVKTIENVGYQMGYTTNIGMHWDDPAYTNMDDHPAGGYITDRGQPLSPGQTNPLAHAVIHLYNWRSPIELRGLVWKSSPWEHDEPMTMFKVQPLWLEECRQVAVTYCHFPWQFGDVGDGLIYQVEVRYGGSFNADHLFVGNIFGAGSAMGVYAYPRESGADQHCNMYFLNNGFYSDKPNGQSAFWPAIQIIPESGISPSIAYVNMFLNNVVQFVDPVEPFSAYGSMPQDAPQSSAWSNVFNGNVDFSAWTDNNYLNTDPSNWFSYFTPWATQDEGLTWYPVDTNINTVFIDLTPKASPMAWGGTNWPGDLYDHCWQIFGTNWRCDRDAVHGYIGTNFGAWIGPVAPLRGGKRP